MSSTSENKKKLRSKKSIREDIQNSGAKEGSHASPRLPSILKTGSDNNGSPTNNNVQEICIGLEEGGKEGLARRYTSVAHDDKSATDMSVARLENIGLGIPSGVNSPVEGRSEEGVGSSIKRKQAVELEMQDRRAPGFGQIAGIAYYCQKRGCRLQAYGRCQWKNPCSLPEKKGGCNDLYCELHAASQLENFRKFQCCIDCHGLFMDARKWRQRARLYSFVITVLALVLIGISAAYIAVSTQEEQSIEGEQSIFTEVLADENGMTEEISKDWGLRAHVKTNNYRKAAGYEILKWDDQLHQLAYGRGKDVASGVIPFGQTNFVNLLSQARTIFSPKEVYLSEQMSKIVNVYSMDEDYLSEWENAWTVDHETDILGDFNYSTTSVYFNAPEYEIIIIQLFGDVIDVVEEEW